MSNTGNNLNREKIKGLLAKPAQFVYFFAHLDKPGWFDFLDELKVFDDIPGPQATEDGQYIQYPPWWPGQYLIKVADKIPEKVAEVLKKIKTENQTALSYAMQAVLKMPVNISKELLPLVDKWLDIKYRGSIDRYSTELFDKFVNEKEYDTSLRLLDILSKPIKGKRQEVEFRVKSRTYKKLTKNLSELIEYKGMEVLTIVEKRLKEAIYLEYGEKEVKSGGSSTGWRPAIEESEQNWREDEIKDMLLIILRDILSRLAVKSPRKAKETLERYLKEGYSIFRRLAIHIVRVCDFDELAINLLTERDNLDRYEIYREIYHEFFKLMEDKFGKLNSEQKKRIISWIIEGPAKESLKIEDDKEFLRYKRIWQARRLLMLKKHLEKDKDLEEFQSLVDEYHDEFSKIEHPDFLTFHTPSWVVGPASPINKETIKKMSPDEFIDYIKEFEPAKDDWAPSPGGLARIFEEVVKEKPAPYAEIAERFLEEGIWPAYVSSFLSGLEYAWRDGKDFDWKPIVSLCEKVIRIAEEPEIKNRKDEFDYGRFSWVRGAVANLLAEAVKEDGHPIPQEFMPQLKEILFYIIENDEDPTEENEKESGPEADNMDYVDFAINCNRGKAMHALMQYALRYARIHSDKEAERGKGPFSPGERFEPDVKDFLNKRLKKEETSPSVHSTFGQFLPYIYYLDQNWVEKKLDENLLFPDVKDRFLFWEADWEGFIGFNNFYAPLFKLLKADYIKAIDLLEETKEKNERKESHYNYRLAEHLMIAYWRKLEDLEKKDSLVIRFFKKAPVEVRNHAIGFMGKRLERNKLSKEDWQNLKKLWNNRIDSTKDEELVAFVDWLKYAPETIEELVALIEPIIPHLHKGYQEEDFLEYLKGNVENYAKITLELLINLLKIRESVPNIIFGKEIVKDILSKAHKKKETAELVNEAVNLLGEAGYYEFRDLLV